MVVYEQYMRGMHVKIVSALSKSFIDLKKLLYFKLDSQGTEQPRSIEQSSINHEVTKRFDMHILLWSLLP